MNVAQFRFIIGILSCTVIGLLFLLQQNALRSGTFNDLMGNSSLFVGRVLGPSSKRIRLFCSVMTSKDNHKNRGVAVRDTWLRRCDGHVFLSSAADDALPALALNTSEGRASMWHKTMQGFRFVHTHHLRSFDWFLKTDDDTYVVVENLRRFLEDRDTDAPQYIGCEFKMMGGFMSGGPGYILSKGGLRAFVERGLGNRNCTDREGDDDVFIGNCMTLLGVPFVDTRDEGKLRMVPSHLENVLFPTEKDGSQWISSYSHKPMAQGRNCCSDAPISFHNVMPEEMYLYEYLLYSARRPAPP